LSNSHITLFLRYEIRNLVFRKHTKYTQKLEARKLFWVVPVFGFQMESKDIVLTLKPKKRFLNWKMQIQGFLSA
jgi:hypothetical protein